MKITDLIKTSQYSIKCCHPPKSKTEAIEILADLMEKAVTSITKKNT